MTNHALKHQSGLNLVEILVAALILSVGLLSLAGLQVSSLKSAQNSTQKQQAAFMIHELFERMRANRAAVISGDYNITEAESVTLCSAGLGKDCAGSGVCTAAETAAYDLFTIQCGNNASGAVNSGAGSSLIAGQFKVNCTGTHCSVGFSWKDRVTEKGLVTEDDGGSTVELTAENQSLSNISIDAVI